MITHLDHIVLTVSNIETTCRFYKKTLGIESVEFKPGRFALMLGAQKINLHELGKEFEPKANIPTLGSADLCLVSDESVLMLKERILAMDIEILEGPVHRTGATGKLLSIYFRDPDGNLVEVANAVSDDK